MTDQNLSANEIKQLTSLLAKLEPGFLPLDIFYEIARLVALSIVEFVPLRLNDQGQAEVLLIPRDADDKFWPNEFHIPGVVVRPTDIQNGHYTPFNRILADELKGVIISEPHFVKNMLRTSRRGTEQAQIYWVEVYDQPVVGEFYKVEELPDNIIEIQPEFIRVAAQDFLAFKR